MNSIKAIVFDAYGTLFDVHSVIPKIESFFPGQGKKISEIWRRKQLEYTWQRSLMGRYRDFGKVTDDALAFTLKSLGLRADAEIRYVLVNEYLVLKPFPEAARTLHDLRRHKTLAILSNGTPFMLQGLVNHAGFRPFFSALISVDTIKIYKPYMGIYQLAPSILGVGREEILFVSANSWDAAGGKTFGFPTCWVNRFHGTFDELDVTPDLIVSSLDELITFLPQVDL
ncbi:haloacid dehalogenase type II [Cohnella sp. CFH 77786]|uniref:haloacid dehalogenase type II n=1 Tax=Cohnella sp. CFH 77786 TaxID=2662265 RepID=UPI001C60C257|nr:haloacid dehalogenase type II [Cohnella sp. CFH 77786]MBW5447187.1 haloacid dehalogenase type II [Cohnella sp. CFH 77786]